MRIYRPGEPGDILFFGTTDSDKKCNILRNYDLLPLHMDEIRMHPGWAGVDDGTCT